MLTDKEIRNNKEQIIELLQSTKREGIDKVIKYLEESGFFIVPSTKHHHHNWQGGLAQQSLNVYKEVCSAGTDIDKGSLIIASLLHEICKARMLYFDDEGNIHHREVHIQGHGNRSIKILETIGFKLTEDERLAIRWLIHSRQAQSGDSDDLIKARKSALWRTLHMAYKKETGMK